MWVHNQFSVLGITLNVRGSVRTSWQVVFVKKKCGNVGNWVYILKPRGRFVFGVTDPQWARASSFTRILDHTHHDAPQTVWLLWTNDQLVAESSNWQYTSITTDTHPCPRWHSNPQSQQASGHWNRLRGMYLSLLAPDAHLSRGVHTYFAREHLCSGDLVLKWKRSYVKMAFLPGISGISRSYVKTPAQP
jgi:hypothetical protein